METKCLELAPEKNGQSFSQKVSLKKGKYEIKFDAAPTKSKLPKKSSFKVSFNGKTVLQVKPTEYAKKTYEVTVEAKEGEN